MLMSTILISMLGFGGTKTRIGFLVVIAICVRSAEIINQYGEKNWESFATQNYFDKRGIFVSMCFSAPLLIMSFSMLVAYLREATTLLVQVKKGKMKKKVPHSKKD